MERSAPPSNLKKEGKISVPPVVVVDMFRSCVRHSVCSAPRGWVSLCNRFRSFRLFRSARMGLLNWKMKPPKNKNLLYTIARYLFTTYPLAKTVLQLAGQPLLDHIISPPGFWLLICNPLFRVLLGTERLTVLIATTWSDNWAARNDRAEPMVSPPRPPPAELILNNHK